MKSVVRLATEGDARAIAEVQVASWQAAYRGLMPDARLDAFTVEARAPVWARILEKRESRTTVCVRDHVVAFCSTGESRDTPGQGEIWALYAHPEVWGTGAGRELIEEAKRELSASYSHTTLWVLAGNTRAIRFYEAAGFELDGFEKVDDGLPHLRMSSGE
jgi:ribosomal protein S18 acetylase RimI-like enzyme